MKKKSKDIKSFVENILLGRRSIYCQINNNQLGELMMKLIHHFIEEKAMKFPECSKLIDRSFFGLCPKCGILIRGMDLAIASTLKEQTDNDNDAMTLLMEGPREIRLLAEGKCANPTCTEKKIEVHWEYMKG
ncbi:MAG: hypothetical protein ACTSP9_12085 [Promethearchaeota archaeon]